MPHRADIIGWIGRENVGLISTSLRFLYPLPYTLTNALGCDEIEYAPAFAIMSLTDTLGEITRTAW